MSYFEFPHTRTYDSDLGWLIKTVKKLTELVTDLEGWKNEFSEAYEQLMKIYDQIVSGSFPPELQAAFSKWMSENALTLVGELVKMVFFGITDEGYFVAYIPEGWDDIIFNTSNYDINTPDLDFGHLMLSFAIGG